MRWSFAAVLAVSACADAITLEVTSDRPVPSAIDAICLGVADTESDGGQFGRLYRLEGKLASLPQTLVIDPGGASHAFAWVRGDRGGVPAARVAHATDFTEDLTLALDRCVRAPSAAPKPVGGSAGPASALLAASQGPGGNLVVAVATGATNVLDARSSLIASAAPAVVGAPTAIVAIDIDGDCDDDVIVATDGAAPAIWRRDRMTFTAAGSIGSAAAAAIAVADVDRDGDTDVVLGSGGNLQLWRNDGGKLAHDAAALSGAGRAVAVTALALADLDGDGSPDLVAGQAMQPLVAWLGSAAGNFSANDAIVPPVPLDVERFSVGDADGDFDPDLGVAIRGAPMRLYIDRGGLLEDQSFVRLPMPIPTAHTLTFGTWDNGCEPDAIVAADAGAPTLRGQANGTFAAETAAPAATDAVLVDIDDDGDLDAIVATAQGAQWLAR